MSDLFFLATNCNVVTNADSDNVNLDFSVFDLSNEQYEGMRYPLISELEINSRFSRKIVGK